MEFLPLLLNDLDELQQLQPVDWADIVAPTRHKVESPSCKVYKAVIDGRMVGTGTIIYNGYTAWLATIIVHPHYRNKGLGKAITQYLIGNIDRTRYATIMLDATNFGYPVYKSVGFETITKHVHFDVPQPYPDAPVSPLIKPFESSYLDQILALDRTTTGEDRKTFLLEKIDTAMVYLDSNKVQGFYLPHLMKGLLVADNPTAGIELMKLRLQQNTNCMLPAENAAAIHFLLANGCLHTHTTSRMRLGPAVAWQPSYIYNVASGALG